MSISKGCAVTLGQQQFRYSVHAHRPHRSRGERNLATRAERPNPPAARPFRPSVKSDLELVVRRARDRRVISAINAEQGRVEISTEGSGPCVVGLKSAEGQRTRRLRVDVISFIGIIAAGSVEADSSGNLSRCAAELFR